LFDSEFGQQLRLVLVHQRHDQIVEVAFEDFCEFIQLDIDAMVRDAPLRKIIGANPFGPIAAADETAAQCGSLGFPPRDLRVFELCREQ